MGQNQLRRVSPDGSISNEWGENLGMHNPADIAGNGKELWVSLADERKLLLIDLEVENQISTYDLGQFQGHFLSLGTRYLLMCDTLGRQLGFFHLSKRELTLIALDLVPGKAIYRSAKFFLVLDNQQVAIYSEDALAPIETLSFSRPIVDLVLDNRFYTWVYTRDSLSYRASISWNSHSIVEPEQEVAESKLRHSPFLRANFGKEYTGPISLINNRLSNFPSPPANDFEVDFFEAKTWFTFRDSLKSKEVFENEIQVHGPFTGNFRNAYFYVAPTSEK